MPEPGKNETQDDFISRCIPIVLEEGTAEDNKQAAAICHSIWREAKKSVQDVHNSVRNSVQIKSLTEEHAIIGGYGALWGAPNDRDLEGDYFTPQTDFWLDKMPGPRPVLYEHGLEADVRRAVLGKTLDIHPDEMGLWVEAQLDRHAKYVTQVLELVEQGVLGWSSGAVSHLVEREKGQLKSWPIAEMTLTVEPAEPRLLDIKELRSLVEGFLNVDDLPLGIEPVEVTEEKTKPKSVNVKVNLREETMTEKVNTPIVSADQFQELFAKQQKMLEEMEQRLVEATNIDVTKTVGEQIDAVVKKLDLVGPKPLHHVKDPEDETKSFGDFLLCIAAGNHRRLNNVYGSKRGDPEDWKSYKAALAEGSGITGGYTVPVEHRAEMMKIAWENSIIRANGARVIPMASRQLEWPVPDYTSAPTAGQTAMYAGVVAGWTAEAGTLGETEPTWRNLVLTAHKLGGYTLSSAEVLADSSWALESYLYDLFGGAIAWFEDYAFLNGTGTGQPYGITLWTTANITSMPDKTTASRFKMTDAANMLSKLIPGSYQNAIWMGSVGFIPELIKMSTAPEATTSGGATLVWQTEGMKPSPFPLQLLGRPFFITEKLPAINTDNSVLLCDLSYYIIGDRGELVIDTSEHYKFVNHQMTWRFLHRVDGQPMLNSYITLSDASTVVMPFVTLDY